MTLEIPGVQNPVMDYARKTGWLAWRMQIMGRNGCPDAFFFKGGQLVMIEFKRPGKSPTPQQLKRHKELRAAGFEVYVVDDPEVGKRLLDELSSPCTP